jgi:hypothetical protein
VTQSPSPASSQARPEPYRDRPDYVEDDRFSRQSSRAEAAAAVAGPAIALMVVGGLAIALALFSLVLNLTGAALVAGGNRGVGQDDQAMATARAAGGVVGAILGVCWGGAVLAGAISMKNLRSHGSAMAASIIAMIPCNICCILGLPFGIWSLVTLSRPEVKDAFG